MSEYLIQSESLTAIADEVRELSGTTEDMSLGEMVSTLDEANSEVGTQTDLIEQIAVAIEGRVFPSTSSSSPSFVLQSKTVVPTTNDQTVTADSGYDALSTVTVEAMPTATQATPTIAVDSSGLITATATQPSGYVVAGTKSATKQLAFQAAKTITPSTVEQIAVSSGYYTGGSVKVAPIPSEYVIPSGTVTISANGTHDVANYKSAVVNVESSGGDTDVEDGLVTRTLTTYTNDRVKSIGDYAFYRCSNLTSVSFPACTSIGGYAFANCSSLKSVSFPVCTTISSYAFTYCSSLTSVNFPACTSIGNNAFANCSSLKSVSFPACTSIGGSAFYQCMSLTSVSFPACTSIDRAAFIFCSNLTSVSFPACKTIGSSAFNKCYRLSTVILDGSTRCTLSNSNAFSSTPFKGYSTYFSGTPYIYVPASLLNSYATATNWAYFSAYFSTIESLGLGGGSSGSTSGSTYSL